MALIHEALGIVVWDPSGRFAPGDRVAMIPNSPPSGEFTGSENYHLESRFRASSQDGFMQDLVFLDPSRVAAVGTIVDDVGAFLELISVAWHSIRRFRAHLQREPRDMAIWGDGSLAFIVALLLKNLLPGCHITVIGKSAEKLAYFSFADSVRVFADGPPSGPLYDHGFEAVGGKASGAVLDQMVSAMRPEGSLNLLGVSEEPVLLRTRDVLERGLLVIGSSRSGRDDFLGAIAFLQDHPEVQNHLLTLVSERVTVSTLDDITRAFERDSLATFKTILLWNM